ncbi:MAG: MATE family efflux transporter [Bacteroidaceae bacterium]|nr:MATE family efflux transporter [Bacteroidaceae bacterium]
MSNTHREILRLALPSVATNISVPLLGLVDTAIVGHLGLPEYIAAIAIGTTVFNVCYWIFAFLRMGTTGLVAQAKGCNDTMLIRDILQRALLLGGLLSVVLLLLQGPILHLSLWLMPAEAETAQMVATYFGICIWGAPAMLSLFVLNGWFIGCQDTRSPMWIAIGQNLLNIAVSLMLVFRFGWKIEGVATGTLCAQWSAFLLALLLMQRHQMPANSQENEKRHVSLRRFLGINRDIFLRTVCLVAVTLYFTSAGTRLGNTTLAANAILMQFFIFYSYFTDGLANAAEALSGKYAGAGNKRMLDSVVRAIFVEGGIIAAAFALVYLCSGHAILRLLTDQASVVQSASDYLPWVIVIPIVALPAMVWDGVFIGLTWTRRMLLSMSAAALVFFVVCRTMPLCMPPNHALWLAFDAYLLTRGALQTVFTYNRQTH